MPIYEYRCESCSHQLEKLQKISDDKLIDCPQCNEPALKRLVSAAAFRLKGSGWYETDFKTGDKKNLAGGSEKSETKPAPSGDKAAKKETSGSGESKKSA